MKITPETTVRQIIMQNYNAKAFFEKHGMKGCGGKYGPIEKLSYFAKVHDLSLDSIIKELEAAPQGKTTSQEELVAELSLQKEKQKGFFQKVTGK